MLSNSITPESLGIIPLAEDEIFRPAKHNGETFHNYLISNYGRYYSKHRGRLLTPRIKKDKRIGIKLYIDGKDRYFFAHRLVAFAFSLHNPDPDNFKIINHIDENPQNNKLDNLEWCDDKYNLNYREAQKRKVLKRNKRIRQYDKKNESYCRIYKHERSLTANMNTLVDVT